MDHCLLLKVIELLLIPTETKDQIDLAILLDKLLFNFEIEVVNPEEQEVSVQCYYDQEEQSFCGVIKLGNYEFC
jgi:hypothetical protein